MKKPEHDGCINRRQFLGRSALAAGVFAAPYIAPRRATAASDRLVMGCIGVGSQGTGNILSIFFTEILFSQVKFY